MSRKISNEAFEDPPPIITEPSARSPKELNTAFIPIPRELKGLLLQLSKIKLRQISRFGSCVPKEYEILDLSGGDETPNHPKIFRGFYHHSNVICFHHEIAFDLLSASGDNVLLSIDLNKDGEAKIFCPPGSEIGSIVQHKRIGGWYNFLKQWETGGSFEAFGNGGNTCFISQQDCSYQYDYLELRTNINGVDKIIGYVEVDKDEKCNGPELMLHWLKEDSLSTETKVLGLGFLLFLFIQSKDRMLVVMEEIRKAKRSSSSSEVLPKANKTLSKSKYPIKNKAKLCRQRICCVM